MSQEGLTICDVRRQFLAHLRQHHKVEATHLVNGGARPCIIEHAMTHQGDDPELSQITTPLRMVYTDEKKDQTLWTWGDLYKCAYVKASPLNMIVFSTFAFQPKIFSTAPSLGDQDATAAEICNALRALSGTSTPVMATVDGGEEEADRQERLRLTPRWCDEEGEGDTPVVTLQLSPMMSGASTDEEEPSRPLEFRHLWMGLNTENIVAPELVRNIAAERKMRPK